MFNTAVQAVHCNGRHPSFPGGGATIHLLDDLCAPHGTKGPQGLLMGWNHESLPPGLVASAYEALQFCLVPGEPGTHGDYLPVGLQFTSETHMRLRDVLLAQPDFAHESPVTPPPWYEPPFLAPSARDVLETPRDPRTAENVADFLKSRFRPATAPGKKPRELR